MKAAAAAAVSLAVLAFFTVPSQAVELENKAGNWGLHLGYAKTKDAENGNYMIGGHLELQPAPILGIQGAIDYRDTDDVRLSSQGADDDLVIRTVPITVTGRLYLPMGPSFEPFAAAGAGWYHLRWDFSEALEEAGIEDHTDTSFGWHLGAGARVAVSPRVSLYGEGRYVFLDPERSFDESVQDDIEDIDFNQSFVAGGLNFHF
jgi:opacity protein-like surface antigen